MFHQGVLYYIIFKLIPDLLKPPPDTNLLGFILNYRKFGSTAV